MNDLNPSVDLLNEGNARKYAEFYFAQMQGSLYRWIEKDNLQDLVALGQLIGRFTYICERHPSAISNLKTQIEIIGNISSNLSPEKQKMIDECIQHESINSLVPRHINKRKYMVMSSRDIQEIHSIFHNQPI